MISGGYQNISDWRAIPKDIIPAKITLDYVECLRRRRSQRNFIKSETLVELENLYFLY
ncbi:MAG: hypothetical protein KAI69_02150 [Deltaproteobacteria bacterium]|nr:hypothetical protein [Deltaproteobacteria bacterium]